MHPDFPIVDWDRLLPQAFNTLNLLHTANANPNLSTCSYLFRNFDFNRTPMAPPGSKNVIHQKPSKRASWYLNGKIAFYIGPALHHYRCMTCYVPSTNSEIISNTLHFIPYTIPIPTVTIDSFLQQYASDIINILNNPKPTLPTSYQLRNKVKDGLLQLVSIFKTNQITNEKLSYLQQLTENTFIKQNNPHNNSTRHPINKKTTKKQNVIITTNNFQHDLKHPSI